jgi:hypothetical protein
MVSTIARNNKGADTASPGRLPTTREDCSPMASSDDTTRGPRAIETAYKGYRFRSRIEARWAVFFDTLGVRWEYEKEGYELANGARYLPDFWLPDLECFVEVKGAEPTDDEHNLAHLLREESGSPVVIVHGEVSSGPWPCYAHDIGHDSGGNWDGLVRWFVCECGKPKVSWGDGCHVAVNGRTWASLPHWCGWDTSYSIDACGPKFPEYLAVSSTSRAVNAARSARFGKRGRG